MDIKFKIGQKVKVLQDGEVCEVLRVAINENGVLYTLSSKDWDSAKKEVIQGVKHCYEDELELYKEPKQK